MRFATVATRHQPFDRLIRGRDALPPDELNVQYGLAEARTASAERGRTR